MLNMYLIVKVRGQISLYRGGTVVFGLSAYPVSEFELVAEELLMSDSIIKVCYNFPLLVMTPLCIVLKIKSSTLSFLLFFFVLNSLHY